MIRRVPLDSESLLPNAAAGERAVVDALLARHLPGLRAFVRLRMGPELRAGEESCDLVQSVCREVLQSAAQLQHGGEAGFRHWLYRTAQRKVADRAEFHTAARCAPGRERALASDDDALLAQYRSVCSPSRAAAAREELARVEAAFDKLPAAQREAILGARLIGLTHAELAARMGRSKLAVRTLLCRGLARLTQLMADADAGPTAARAR